MFLLSKPAPDFVADFVRKHRDASLTYREVGATRGEMPAGYVGDKRRELLGHGLETYEAAARAVRGWEMFGPNWVQVHDPATPLEVGQIVAIISHTLFVWSLNACRIVYVIDERDGEGARFGFAYGTLRDHAGRGEERFLVEYVPDEEAVYYEIRAFSRPQQWLSRIFYPYMRRKQKQFGRDSAAAMRAAVAAGQESRVESQELDAATPSDRPGA